MNVVLPRQRMTVEEYLAWAEGKPGRFELVDGNIIQMSAERVRHNRVKMAVARALEDSTKAAQLPCTVFTDGMTIKIDKHTAREPDAAVQCGLEADLDALTLEAPLIVVEVVSPSSERKYSNLLVEYFSVPSVRHYIVVHPTKHVVVHHRRNDDGMIDTRRAYEGEDIVLAPPGVTVAVTALVGPVGGEARS